MSHGDGTLIFLSRFRVAIFAASKSFYFYSKAVIKVQFFMEFGVLGNLCRFFIANFIAYHLNVDFHIIINCIRDESSDFFATD